MATEGRLQQTFAGLQPTRQAGLDVQVSKGLQHNPISGRYWLSDDTSVNYMLASRRPTE